MDISGVRIEAHNDEKSLKMEFMIALILLGIDILISLILILGGIMFNSLALLSNGLETFTDISTFIITIYFCLIITRKPPDIAHQYGHGKYSAFSSILVSIIMITMAVYIFMNTGYHLRTGYELAEDSIYIAPLVLLPPFLSNTFFHLLYRRYGEIGFIAEARHQLIDFLDSIPAIVGVYCGYFISSLYDTIGGIIVAFSLLGIAILNIRDSSYVLLDYGLDPGRMVSIKRFIEEDPKIVECRRIRSRRLDENSYYIDMILILNPLYSIKEADTVVHEIERRIKDSFPYINEIVIHVHAETGR